MHDSGGRIVAADTQKKNPSTEGNFLRIAHMYTFSLQERCAGRTLPSNWVVREVSSLIWRMWTAHSLRSPSATPWRSSIAPTAQCAPMCRISCWNVRSSRHRLQSQRRCTSAAMSGDSNPFRVGLRATTESSWSGSDDHWPTARPHRVTAQTLLHLDGAFTETKGSHVANVFA